MTQDQAAGEREAVAAPSELRQAPITRETEFSDPDTLRARSRILGLTAEGWRQYGLAALGGLPFGAAAGLLLPGTDRGYMGFAVWVLAGGGLAASDAYARLRTQGSSGFLARLWEPELGEHTASAGRDAKPRVTPHWLEGLLLAAGGLLLLALATHMPT